MMGTESHIKRMPQIINRFQVRMNETLMNADAFSLCIKNSSCSAVLDDTPSTIYNGIHKLIYKDYNKATKEQKKAMVNKANAFMKNAKDKNYREIYDLIKYFYDDYAYE